MGSDACRRWSAALVGGGVAALLGAALLAAPPLGTDLAAQVARADFFRDHGLTPIDLRWYGGVNQFGYSWVSPAVMALLGPRVTGAMALVASGTLLGLVLRRTGAARPGLAAALGAVAFAGNLVSGRVTYGLGVAVGLAALLLLLEAERAGGLGGGRRARALRAATAATAALAAATSPVAGAFVGLAAGAVILAVLADRSGPPGARRVSLVGGLLMGAGAALPLLVTALLASDGGTMNISPADTRHAVVTSLVVAVLAGRPALRWGGLLSAAMVLGAAVVESPVGLNATRLPIMFALPVLAGYARWPGRTPFPGVPGRFPGVPGRLTRGVAVGVLLSAVAWWQPPVLARDLADLGNPTARRSYFAPLARELARRPVGGRLEVPPTRDYWEAAHLADVMPLARGWLRQVDLARNPLFFDDGLDPEEYRRWLVDTGVSYVAVPDAAPSWVARTELAVIRRNPPYLTEVWRSEHWTLFEVEGQPGLVSPVTPEPAAGRIPRVVSATGAEVVVEVPAPGDILVRVAPAPALRVRGPARISPGRSPDGRWTVLRITTPGRYTVTSWTPGLTP